MKPYDVKTEDEILAMESDNHGGYDVWSIMTTADHVSLHPPVAEGQTHAKWVEIPRDQFNAIVDWYIADQAVAS